MINIEKWIPLYKQAIIDIFESRVLFIGIQGSYGRKEASDSSDIDVVLILDKVDIENLVKYRKAVDALPHRDLLCGFVSGRDEIANWSKSDLFQFYFDTIALHGNLDCIIPTITVDDAKQAVLIGACNIYHACSHNFLHTMDSEALRSICKSIFFVLQAKYYCEIGTYIHSKIEMQECIGGQDKPLFQAAISPSIIDQNSFEKYSSLLLEWSKNLISRYGSK